MSLFRPYQEFWDMPFDPKVSKGEKHVPSWMTYVALIVTWFIPNIIWRFRVYGKKNLRALAGKTGVVIVANHASFIDPYFIIRSALFKQWPRFMAKDDLFTVGNGRGGFFMSRLGAFPIKRDSADRIAIKRAAKMLEAGETVCLFPEGTRRGKTDYNITLHTGAAFMARMAGVPVIPAGITGANKLHQNGKLHFPKITVSYGKPVYEQDFSQFPRHERLDAMTWFFVREVHALSEGIAPEEVNMDALYPGSISYAEAFKDFVPASWTAAEGEEECN